MNTIKVLDQTTIDKIAAGEVVERPASVVKELLENAIDAGAGAVTVEIRDGGKSMIRITDNGAGIQEDQIRLAFTRHATSKIRNIGDLVQIESLGFRGEALSSIAAVSQVEMITKTPDSLTGTRYCIEGGREVSLEEIGAPSGTTIIVRNLFYNTPARAKFLRTAAAEGSRAAAVIEEIALSHPDVSFKFMMNGQNRLFTSGNGNLKEIIYQIFGKEIAGRLIPVDYQSERVRMSGFIAAPEIARGNRNFENYFVNGRFVKSRIVSRAIEDGYHGHLMQHRYPFTLLYLDLNRDMVDVNVHPSKMEVRISDEEAVYHELTLAIQNALMERERIPEISFAKQKRQDGASAPLPHLGKNIPEPFETVRRTGRPEPGVSGRENVEKTPAGAAFVKEGTASAGPAPGNEGTAPKAPAPGNEETAPKASAPVSREMPPASETEKACALKESAGSYRKQEESRPETGPADPAGERGARFGKQTALFDDAVLSKEARPHHRMIGQIFGTYWLIEYGDALYIIDQHAAHEKVLYERLMKQYREKKINSQILFPAPVVTLTIREQQILEQNLDRFRVLGFEIEPFGGRSCRITAVPDNLYRVRVDQLFTEMIDNLSETGGQKDQIILERIASMSCKAAVKGSREMSTAEADALIDELLGLENPYHCPHGRPTIVRMTHSELDRKFRRIV